MRVAEVIGTVTLSRRLENIAGGRFILAQPMKTDEILRGSLPMAEPVVAYDELSAGVGLRIALAEGREAAMPLMPRSVPIDAYCAAILDNVEIADSELNRADAGGVPR